MCYLWGLYVPKLQQLSYVSSAMFSSLPILSISVFGMPVRSRTTINYCVARQGSYPRHNLGSGSERDHLKGMQLFCFKYQVINHKRNWLGNFSFWGHHAIRPNKKKYQLTASFLGAASFFFTIYYFFIFVNKCNKKYKKSIFQKDLPGSFCRI